MKTPAVIITDSAEATKRCLSQRPVSHEKAVESIREPKPSQALSCSGCCGRIDPDSYYVRDFGGVYHGGCLPMIPI